MTIMMLLDVALTLKNPVSKNEIAQKIAERTNRDIEIIQCVLSRIKSHEIIDLSAKKCIINTIITHNLFE